MGFFSPFEYKNTKGERFWLHTKERRGSRVYFFSKEPEGAEMFKPSGFVVAESRKTGMPYLKKGGSGIFSLIFGVAPAKKQKSSQEKKKTQI